MVFRLAPQPLFFTQMKLDHLAHWQAREFVGYSSPWIPVCEANAKLLKRGDLIRSNGFDSIHEIGRDIYKFNDGRKTGADRRKFIRPDFVWVDARERKVAPFLRKNPYREKYKKYSNTLGEALRSGGIALQDAQFPIFHETSLSSAQRIMQMGIDIRKVTLRDEPVFGPAFYASSSLDGAVGPGNRKGALVRFDTAMEDGKLPTWLTQRSEIALTMIFCARSIMDKRAPHYNWGVACSELSASALLTGCVAIFDSFEEYLPTEIIETDR